MAVLADPLRLVVGDKAAKRLASALDLHTVGDLDLYDYLFGTADGGDHWVKLTLPVAS